MRTVIVSCMLLCCVLCGCVRQETVPQMPWRLLISSDRPSTIVHWKGDVSVKLLGAYSHDDSLKMEHSLAIINEICSTVKLSMSEKERGDIEIFFVENMTELGTKRTPSKPYNEPCGWSFSWGDKGIASYLDMTLNKAVLPDSVRQNSLTHVIALALCPQFLDFYAAEMMDAVSMYNPSR